MSYICIPNDNIINIGSRGGATRPSSGYTFYFIQKQIEKIVKQMNYKSKISSKVHNDFNLFMDQVFIDVIDKNVNKSPQIFLDLTSNLTGDEMAFFMTGKFKLIIWIKIILNLPKTLFLKSFFKKIING